MTAALWRYMEVPDLRKIFQQAVPKATRAILGDKQLTRYHFLDNRPTRKNGIYIDYVVDADFATEEADGLYVGSCSKTGGWSRIQCHHTRIRQREKKCAHYNYIWEGASRTPNFRCLAQFPTSLPGIPHADLDWVLVLFETVFITTFRSYEHIKDLDSLFDNVLSDSKYREIIQECDSMSGLHSRCDFPLQTAGIFLSASSGSTKACP
jgi:hypothetical protein